MLFFDEISSVQEYLIVYWCAMCTGMQTTKCNTIQYFGRGGGYRTYIFKIFNWCANNFDPKYLWCAIAILCSLKSLHTFRPMELRLLFTVTLTLES